jgi:arginyl-tRNA synthetase
VAQTALGFRCLAMTQEEGEKFDHFAARVYVELSSKIENDQNLQDKQAEIIEALDHHNEDTSVFVKDIAKKIVQENLKTMADYGVDYDLMVWESDIIKFGFWQKAFEILKSSASFIKIEDGKNAGCYVIKDVMGDDKVIVKSNGIVTYTGKDIAYHLWKFNLLGSDFRYSDYPTDTQKKKLVSTNSDGEPSQDYGRADEVVNIVDVRQSFPQQAVMESLKSLGYQKQADNFHHVGYGVVNLSAKTAQELGVDVSSGKSSFAMSGRKGVGVFADDLLLAMKEKIKKNHPNSPCIDDIAVGAIKYYMLNYNTYSDIAFDFDRALDIYGNSGPYIQYTHARCQSVLDKVSDVETDLDRDAGVELGLIESELLRSLYHFDEAANASGAQYAPNILSNYLFELAKRFNHFYATCPIANCEDQQLKKIRIIICKSSQLILKTGLELLGITAPDKM